MKRKILQRTVALACTLLLGMATMAQATFQPIQDSKVFNPTGKLTDAAFSNSNYQMNQVHDQASVSHKAEGDMCTVTFNLDYDHESFRAPYMVIIISEDMKVSYAFSSGEDQLLGQVAPGVYDFFLDFTDRASTSTYVVIKEQVEINEDLTFNVSPSECVNQITTKCYGPDGEILKHGLCHFDESIGDYVIDETSDIGSTSVKNFCFLKGLAGSLLSSSTLFSGEQLSEDKRLGRKDFFVNDVSSRYLFVQERTSATNDATKAYCNYYSTDDVKVGVLENNPEAYSAQIFNYKYTPFGRTINGYALELDFWLFMNNLLVTNTGMGRTNLGLPKQSDCYTGEVWLNIPEVDTCYPDMKILVQPLFAEDAVLIEPTSWTYGPAISMHDGQKEFVNFGHNKREFGAMTSMNNLYNVSGTDFYGYASFVHQFLPSPEAFTYPSEQALGVINNNCPINALKVQAYETSDAVNVSMTSFYVGRYGETCFCDQGSTTSIKYNGEEVGSLTSNTEKGIYEVEIKNPNIEVDDIPGQNTTRVHFDQNQEDMTPPSIEMLHFKNGDGGVIDRFASADDGTMEFYAGDFNYHYYPELYSGLFECQPVEVLVEYAPYGTETWNELAAEEVSELFHMPGWGHFYRGSLAGVTGQAEKGWFDLKVKLTDAAGNWQEQVISPAFRIDDLAYSSVTTVGSDNAHEVARYNLAGQRVDADATGIVIIKMSDGTARKVMVK
ncbi:MAG: hypothetical protein J5980_00070 [Muribaculaceae bacterium]|nr:hypothetical protein [Muribaculaceae bacterium]